MKISAFQPLTTPQKLQILHPRTNKKTDAVIYLVGTDSKEWKSAVKELQTSSLRDKKTELTDIEMIDRAEDDACALYAAVTTGWEGIEDENGPIPFSIEKAKEIYKSAPKIRKQIDAFLGDDKNFLPAN